MSDERLAATCTDCRLRGWSERVDPKTGEMVRGSEVIDLCQRHASLERDNVRLREQVATLETVSLMAAEKYDAQQNQLQTADAVCECVKNVAPILMPEDFCSKVKAWRDTQGGDETTTGGK